jgi:hypothetical protein
MKKHTSSPESGTSGPKKIRWADVLIGVVHSHLYIETSLTYAIELTVPRPEHLSIESFTFSQKARIAAGIGVLRKELIGPVVALNKLRNHLVHKPMTAAPVDAIEEFIAALPKGLRDAMEGVARKHGKQAEGADDPVIRLDAALACLSGAIAAHKELIAAMRKHPNESLERLKNLVMTGSFDVSGDGKA